MGFAQVAEEQGQCTCGRWYAVGAYCGWCHRTVEQAGPMAVEERPPGEGGGGTPPEHSPGEGGGEEPPEPAEPRASTIAEDSAPRRPRRER